MENLSDKQSGQREGQGLGVLREHRGRSIRAEDSGVMLWWDCSVAAAVIARPVVAAADASAAGQLLRQPARRSLARQLCRRYSRFRRGQAAPLWPSGASIGAVSVLPHSLHAAVCAKSRPAHELG